MARRVKTLLFLLSVPCGLASPQAEAQLRGNVPPDAEVAPGGRLSQASSLISRKSLGVPHTAEVISAAQCVLANINTTRADFQDLFVQANQTVVDVVDSATTKTDSFNPILAKVQPSAGDLNRSPSSLKSSADVIQGLLIAFAHQMNASADIARSRILDAESHAFATLQRALDEIREAAEAVLLKFGEALEKVADMLALLEKSAVPFQASQSFLAETATRGHMNARQSLWPLRNDGEKQTVWDRATIAIVAANQTLRLLVERLDGINATLMEVAVAPLGSTAQGAMADFSAACNMTMYVLLDQVPSQAAEVCNAIEDANGVLTGVLTDGLGKLGRSAANVTENANALCGPVFDMVEVLYKLVDQAQDAFKQHRGRRRRLQARGDAEAASQ